MSTLSLPADEAPPLAPTLCNITETLLLCWCNLLLIIVAEILLTTIGAPLGLTLHAGLLVSLLVQGALASRTATRRLAIALSLVPLCRLLPLALPPARFPEPFYYLIASVPLLLAVVLAIVQLRLSPADIGFRLTALPLQLLVGCGGLGIGLVASAVLQPDTIAGGVTRASLWLPALGLLVIASFTSELMFRGVFLAVAPAALGLWSPVFTALVFAALHSGYRSAAGVIFAFGLGLLFAYIVRLGGSILGVTLAHSAMNVTVFLILPLTAHDRGAASTFGLTAALGALGALVGLYYLVLLQRLRSTPRAEAHAGSAMRSRRRKQGIYYTELARLTGLSARTLAEIELGMRPMLPEEAELISRALEPVRARDDGTVKGAGRYPALPQQQPQG